MAAKRQTAQNSKSAKSSINRVNRPKKLTPHKKLSKTIRKVAKTPGALQAGRTLNRIVLLDACNVAHKNRYLPRFSADRLSKAIQFFVAQNCRNIYAIVPKFHLYTSQWDRPEYLRTLHQNGLLITSPCKEYPNPKSQVYEDRITMAIAHSFNCAVVSNDQFRDVAQENEDWRTVANNQRVPFDWRGDDVFTIPDYGYSKL